METKKYIAYPKFGVIVLKHWHDELGIEYALYQRIKHFVPDMRPNNPPYTEEPGYYISNPDLDRGFAVENDFVWGNPIQKDEAEKILGHRLPKFNPDWI